MTRSSSNQFVVRGFFEKGDGGGGVFVWRPEVFGHDGGVQLSPNVAFKRKDQSIGDFVTNGLGWWTHRPTVQGVWVRQYDLVRVSVNWFGIFGDGVTDYSNVVNKVSKWAALNGQGIYFPGGTYIAHSFVFYAGIPIVEGRASVRDGIQHNEATLRGLPATTRAGRQLPYEVHLAPAVNSNGLVQFPDPKTEGTTIRNLHIDMSQDDTAGIFVANCQRCSIYGNTIDGFSLRSVLNASGNEVGVYKYGILLKGGSSNNVIRHNVIEASPEPVATQDRRQMLIAFHQGGEPLPFGGYFINSGAPTRPAFPASYNVITANVISNGAYAVLLLGGERNKIYDNTMRYQSHRGVAMYNSWYNTIQANRIHDFFSSGVLLGYMSLYNIVNGNTMTDTADGRKDADEQLLRSGEAAVNVLGSSSMNTIEGNTIDARRNYGVYLAIGAYGNKVRSNEIKHFMRAGIAIENDWEPRLPYLARYSRSNFAEASTVNGRIDEAKDNWAFQDTQLNELSANTISEPVLLSTLHPACGIYISALSTDGNPTRRTIATRNWRNKITGNVVVPNAKFAHTFYLYEDEKGLSVSNHVSGNDFGSDIRKIAASQPNAFNFTIDSDLKTGNYTVIESK